MSGQVDQLKCPLCDQAAEVQTSGDRLNIQCRRCGTFGISRTAAATLRTNELRPYISCHTRQASELGHVVVVTDTKDTLASAERHRDSSPLRRADLALSYFVQKFEEFDGQEFCLDSDDGFAFDAVTLAKTSQVIEHLHHEGFIERLSPKPMAQQLKVLITPTLRGAHLVWRGGGDTARNTVCFVAMSFAKEHAGIFEEAIEPAILESGYEPIRVDKHEYNDKINDKIIAEIRRCKFMVADFTGHKGGVYYEAGFAKGLDRVVIFTCSNEKNERDGLHFDTRDYNHILWESHEQLRERLVDRIRATIGQGPLGT